MLLPALSIQQPWAYAIVHLGKDIENRVWWTKLREKFFIHASKTIDQEGYVFLTERNLYVPPPNEIERGGIIGTAELTGCVKKSSSPWFFGPYGFELSNQKPLKFQYARGQLGFFTLEYKEGRW